MAATVKSRLSEEDGMQVRRLPLRGSGAPRLFDFRGNNSDSRGFIQPGSRGKWENDIWHRVVGWSN